MKKSATNTTTERTATFTFCDSGENNVGMEQLGHMVDKGHGFNKTDLERIQKNLTDRGVETELTDLRDLLNDDLKEGAEEAYVLVARNVLGNILKGSEKTIDDFYKEVFREEIWDKQYRCPRRGRVLNKRARWNNVICDIDREPDYINGKGRLISWKNMENLSMVKDFIEEIGDDKMKGFVCEGNYYYNLTKGKTGIGFHGDAERRKVVALRLGSSMTLCYSWYHYSKAIGEKLAINLNSGDMYFMSEEAVGTEWKMRSRKKLRHSAGPEGCKYIQVKK